MYGVGFAWPRPVVAEATAGPDAWAALWPAPQVYTVMCVCMGLTVGAQGPAAISLAKQCGMIRGC